VSGVAPVKAADDDPILVGGEYTASTVTKLTNSENSNRVFEAASTGEGTAIVAESELGTGLLANCGQGVAVFANTTGWRLSSRKVTAIPLQRSRPSST